MEELLSVFGEIAGENFPQADFDELCEALRKEIKKRKFDLQDEALLETALRDDKSSFKNSFLEMLGEKLEKTEDTQEFLSSDENRNEVISLLMATVEQTIDYYYTALIGKHFSSS